MIGKRQYAGYVDDISPAGAKLRTLTSIQRIGPVTLTLPDLPPIHGHLRWNDEYNAGVEFAQPLTRQQLSIWADARAQLRRSTSLTLTLVPDLPEPVGKQPELNA